LEFKKKKENVSVLRTFPECSGVNEIFATRKNYLVFQTKGFTLIDRFVVNAPVGKIVQILETEKELLLVCEDRKVLRI
jgi:hypothetical protein